MKNFSLLLLTAVFSLSMYGQDCTTPETLPYFEEFASGSPACWAYENIDGINPVWIFNGSEDLNEDGTDDPLIGLFAPNLSSIAKNDWAFTPSIQLEAGIDYEVTVTYNSYGPGTSVADERMDMYMATAQTSAMATELIGEYESIPQVGFINNPNGFDVETLAYVSTETYSPTTSGEYHVALHARGSETAAGYLLVFSVGVVEVESTSCPGDFNGDGEVNVTDFLSLNSAFGQACEDCPEDLSGNGVVDISDFIEFNSVFGNLCD